MKRLLLSLALALGIGSAAHAQFTAGTKYIGATLSGMSMSYNKDSEFNFSLGATAGYYVADGWMIKGDFGYGHVKASDDLTIGAGFRYSFLQNGIFIGAGLEYEFEKYKNVGGIYEHQRLNNMRLPIEIGYTFYLNHYLALEPAVYSKMSLNNFADGTEFGLRIGFGFYFDRLHNVK